MKINSVIHSHAHRLLLYTGVIWHNCRRSGVNWICGKSNNHTSVVHYPLMHRLDTLPQRSHLETTTYKLSMWLKEINLFNPNGDTAENLQWGDGRTFGHYPEVQSKQCRGTFALQSSPDPRPAMNEWGTDWAAAQLHSAEDQCENTTYMYNVEFSSSWGFLKVSGENIKKIYI